MGNAKKIGLLALAVLIVMVIAAPMAMAGGAVAAAQGYVVIEEFAATAADNDVWVFWRTSQEDPTTIFTLHRENEETGESVLLAEVAGTALQGAKYEYSDYTLDPGVYTYILVATGELGAPPVAVSAVVVIEPPTAVRLSAFFAR
jgi:hypothetical protein